MPCSVYAYEINDIRAGIQSKVQGYMDNRAEIGKGKILNVGAYVVSPLACGIKIVYVVLAARLDR